RSRGIVTAPPARRRVAAPPRHYRRTSWRPLRRWTKAPALSGWAAFARRQPPAKFARKGAHRRGDRLPLLALAEELVGDREGGEDRRLVRLHNRRVANHVADRLVHVRRERARSLGRRIAADRVILPADRDPRRMLRPGHRVRSSCCCRRKRTRSSTRSVRPAASSSRARSSAFSASRRVTRSSAAASPPPPRIAIALSRASAAWARLRNAATSSPR